MRLLKTLFALWSVCSDTRRDAAELVAMASKYSCDGDDIVCVHMDALASGLLAASQLASDLDRISECTRVTGGGSESAAEP